MRKLYIDFETRSKADLPNVGAHKYAMDASTQVLLTAYAFDDDEVNVCEFDNIPDEIIKALTDNEVLKIAHNAEFDMSIFKYTLLLPVIYTQWHDTAYQSSYFGLPRKLSDLAKRLNLPDKMEQEGVKLFSFPLKKKDTFNEPKDYPEEWETFKEYAKHDVETMRRAHKIMSVLPPLETYTMQLTFKMNFAGVPFDLRLAMQIYMKAKAYENNASIVAMNKYGINNLKSPAQVQAALKREGIQLTTLNKKLRLGVTHEILTLRDTAAGSSFSKLPKGYERVCSDGRLHGEFVGHGAHTGRWSSKGVQLHNWTRILEPVSEDLTNVKGYEHLKQHMRLCLGKTSDHLFMYADLSQIEARVVAWIAESRWRMEAFERNVDIYARSAEKMFNIEKVNKDDKERYYGKCAELGFGYGGGHAALRNIVPDFYESAGEEFVRNLVALWRNANPEIVRLWSALEQTFRRAMQSGMSVFAFGNVRITFFYDGKTGKIQLPSGRALYYPGFHVEQSQYGSSLAYWDYTRGSTAVHVPIWGGVLLENIVQAISRDILVDIISRFEKAQPTVTCVGTVHDEIWYLTKENVLDDLLSEARKPIPWAEGLVLNADGNVSDRYRK